MADAVSVESLFRDSSDLFVLIAMDRRIRLANPAMRAVVKGTKAGVDVLDVVPEASRSRVATELARSAGGATVHVEVDHERPDGRASRVEWRFFPVEGGLVAGVGRVRSEEPALADQLGKVSAELKEKTRILDHIQIELTQVPFVDPVTGVWNRLQVVERLTGEWSRSERYGSPITCLIVEIDRHADHRARHGLFVADEILKSVARRLKRTVRDHDVVGRYGDARFVVIAVADGEGAKSLGGRLRNAVTVEPIAVGDRQLPVSIRIGGATNRSEGVEIMEDLFSVAESALEAAAAKQEGIAVIEEIGRAL
jgi:diguanylate cyclase (GGDEF)-like protein